LDNFHHKKSGSNYSDIIKNVTLGHMMGCDSLETLTDKTLKEELLKGNCCVSRSTYSRNMNAMSYNKQNTLLLYLVVHIVDRINFSKKTRNKAIGILDSSPLPVGGITFQGARWVFDSRLEMTVWGYEVMTLLIQIGKYDFPIQFRVNDFSKKGILTMIKRMKNHLGINSICMDGGIKGMEFYKKLDDLHFKFYTKATRDWIYEKFNWFKSAEWWANTMRKFKRNHKYNSKRLHKDGMEFLLVVAKDDNRIFLTNNLSAKPKFVYDTYNRRWNIEQSFREEKQNLGFEDLTVKKRNAIRTHIFSVFIAFIFCQLVMAKFKAINGIKLLIRKVFQHLAKIIKVSENFRVIFIQKFKLRTKIYQLFKSWED